MIHNGDTVFCHWVAHSAMVAGGMALGYAIAWIRARITYGDRWRQL